MNSNNPVPHFFVTGTDTDVGKSVIAFLLLKALADSGYQPLYLKPLQTGCDTPHSPEADAAVIAKRLGDTVALDPEESTLFCLPTPKAPWLAAKDAGRTLAPKQLLFKINAFRQKARPLVIEGAGGLMVPITENFLMIDLMAALAIPVVLVARDGLGTINHTLLAVAALKARDIPILGIVLTAGPGQPTAREIVVENMMAITHFSGIPVAGHIDRIEEFGAVPESAANTMAELLGPLRRIKEQKR